MNYKLVANQVGDLLKYSTTVNEVSRAADSVFPFQRDTFPNDAITSARAQLIYDWVLTLARQSMESSKRNQLLGQFLLVLTPVEHEKEVDKILKNAQIDIQMRSSISHDFQSRNYHELIHKHCRKLFLQENYFHAVFEAAKVYNKSVQKKSQSRKDGQPLMMDVFSLVGVLKLNKGESQTEKDVQEGVKFLSAGLMQALRNPTAHEPALHWPISKSDCLDMLSFISYLLRQLDVAVYYEV